MKSKSRVTDRDHGWREITAAAEKLARGATVKVGILENERGGAREPGEDLTVAEIALVNEFGSESGDIPSRPAHRMTFDRRRAELENEAAHAVVAITLDRKITTREALNAMGMRHAGEIRKTITEGAGVPPPNAPSTIRKKEAKGEWNAGGKAQAAGQGVRPLVDSGVTVNALSWAVEIDEHQEDSQFLTGKGK